MISTRQLSGLPNISDLKKRCQSLALLDAIISPEWLYRYYSFDAHWAANLSLFSMRNGSGDEFFILFVVEGAIIKGFAHESVMSPYRHDLPQVWKGILDTMPASLLTYMSEPALSIQDTTFCIWCTFADAEWNIGDVKFLDDDLADGSAELLSILDGNPESYQKWATEYYEKTLDLAAINSIYQHFPLSDSIIKMLNDSLSMADVSEELRGIDYNS